jgi:uncharacterized protein YegJ (DUF2314 family)
MASLRASIFALVVLPEVAAGLGPSPSLINDSAEISVALVGPTGALSEDSARNAFEMVFKEKGLVQASRMNREDYPGLGAASLKYTAADLAPAERARLERASKVMSLVISWPRKTDRLLREIYGAIASLASKHGALIFDRNCASAYPVAEWRARRLDRGWVGTMPVGPLHFQVHMVVQDDGLIMMDTGGLARFGITDFELFDVNRASTNAAGNLMNAVAQRLIEGARPDARGWLTVKLDDIHESGLRASMMKSCYPNAKRTVVVSFSPVPPADVSRGGREEALKMTFPASTCADPGECLDEALSGLFGSSDHAEATKHGAAVRAAKAKALAALRGYAELVRKGLPQDEVLLVKARFPYSEGNEWMWVDVQSWSGKVLRGRLESEPEYVKDLKPGATVEVRIEDVMDYMYKLSDGSFFGNETGKILRPDLFEDVGGGRSRIRR